MIETTDELGDVVRSGGFQRRFVADVIVDGERVLKDYPLESCDLTSNGNAKVRTQGTASLVYSDELGRSVVPEDLTSWLTPYATYLSISMLISLGAFSEKVLQGSMKVTAVSDPVETKVRNGARLITVGSRVGLTFADGFAVTQRERFIAPASPSSLDSVWDEIGRLTGLPLLRNVADAAITRQVTYQDDRLDAVFDLASILDGTPYMTNDGQVAIQPAVWGDEQEPLTVGSEGTITEVRPDQLTSEGIYNQVVVRSHDTDQTKVLATAELTDGPLRYGGPFGKIPYFASSQFVTDEAAAQTYADSLLPKVSSLPAAGYLVRCVPDPRREVGDVIPFDLNGEVLVGQVAERVLSSSGAMTLRMLVDRG